MYAHLCWSYLHLGKMIRTNTAKLDSDGSIKGVKAPDGEEEGVEVEGDVGGGGDGGGEGGKGGGRGGGGVNGGVGKERRGGAQGVSADLMELGFREVSLSHSLFLSLSLSLSLCSPHPPFSPFLFPSLARSLSLSHAQTHTSTGHDGRDCDARGRESN